MEFEIFVHLVDVGEDILYNTWDDSRHVCIPQNTLKDTTVTNVKRTT